ncbi:unnamed protein product [Clonostachys chloroleuca]|uniref:Uncharacterized protein n=1 Tax=Clonostachys chloroleuca TaxID=1926264 RepID=A0AA35M1B2_9HYPO|nr:unnamed protein product [Clonostachys chloroleuca]
MPDQAVSTAEGTVPGPSALSLRTPDLGQLTDRYVDIELTNERQKTNRVDRLLMDIDSNDSDDDLRRSLPIIPKHGKAAETEAQQSIGEDEGVMSQPGPSSDDEVFVYNSTDSDDPFHLEQDLKEAFPHLSYRHIRDMRHRIERELEKDHLSSDEEEGISFGLEQKISSICPDMEYVHVRAFRRAWESSLKDGFQNDADTIKDAIEGQHFTEGHTTKQAIETEIENRFPGIDPIRRRVLRRAIKSKLSDQGREYANKRAGSAKVRSRPSRHDRQQPYRAKRLERYRSRQRAMRQLAHPQSSQPSQPQSPQPSQPQSPQPSQPQSPQPSQPQSPHPQLSQSRPPQGQEIREQVLKLYQAQPQRPILGPQPHQDPELLGQLQKVYQQLRNPHPAERPQSATHRATKRISRWIFASLLKTL